MAEFCNSEHINTSRTAKLARNKCLFVKYRVQKPKKWQKNRSGVHVPRQQSHSRCVSTDAAVSGHVGCYEWAVNADWRRVSRWLGWPARGHEAKARGCMCGRDGGQMAALSEQLESSGRDDEAGCGGRRRGWPKTAAQPLEATSCGGRRWCVRAVGGSSRDSESTSRWVFSIRSQWYGWWQPKM